MPDATRLSEYAASRGMVWKWRTRPLGEAWEAQVNLRFPVGGVNTNWPGKGPTEQAALDHAIERAIWYWEATRYTQMSHRG